MSAPLRIVLFREGPRWIAQGLDRDFGCQADHLADLMIRLDLVLDREGEGLAALPPAPKYFFDIWDRQAGAFQPAYRFAGRDLQFGIVA